jgi:hypothetical protein
MTIDNTIYKDKVFRHVKRIIGFIDNDVNSRTFGCADRHYWHYKLNDYCNSRFQESCFVLACYYSDKDSVLYKNKKLLGLIKGVINFWCNSQNKNGSVNEIFPHEQSFCATSFSSYIISETLEYLRIDNATYLDKLSKSADWMMKNGNWHISNQIAASAVSLFNIGKITNNSKYIIESEKRLEKLLFSFNKDGFFTEYGGFDLGYNSLTMSLLARLYQKNKNENIVDCLRKLNKKIKNYLDNYARYDNMNMCRNTEYIYPFGFKVINSDVLDKIEKGIMSDLIVNPDWLDDRYLIGMSNDYLMVYYL